MVFHNDDQQRNRMNVESANVQWKWTNKHVQQNRSIGASSLNNECMIMFVKSFIVQPLNFKYDSVAVHNITRRSVEHRTRANGAWLSKLTE